MDLGSTSYLSSRFATAAHSESLTFVKRTLLLTSQKEGVDVLPVVTARHVLLAKTNGVLALRHAIELLQLLLGDALS